MSFYNQKVVLITGGNGVLGSSIANHFSSLGAKIGILGRTESTVQKTVDNLNNKGGTAIALIADVLNRNDLEKACKKLLSKWEKIDILINAAGGNLKEATIMPDDSFFDMSEDAFSKVMHLNLLGTVLPSQVFGKYLIKEGNSCILNISSMAAQLPLTGIVGYSASKAAIDNFTKWLAVELCSKYGKRIRVNAIAPGFFISKQNKTLLLKRNGNLTDRGTTIISQTPMRRFGKPEELNGVVEWICSDAASFVTGIVVPIDGGFSAFSGV